MDGSLCGGCASSQHLHARATYFTSSPSPTVICSPQPVSAPLPLLCFSFPSLTRMPALLALRYLSKCTTTRFSSHVRMHYAIQLHMLGCRGNACAAYTVSYPPPHSPSGSPGLQHGVPRGRREIPSAHWGPLAEARARFFFQTAAL